MGHCPQGSQSLVGRKDKEVEMDHREASGGLEACAMGGEK